MRYLTAVDTEFIKQSHFISIACLDLTWVCQQQWPVRKMSSCSVLESCFIIAGLSVHTCLTGLGVKNLAAHPGVFRNSVTIDFFFLRLVHVRNHNGLWVSLFTLTGFICQILCHSFKLLLNRPMSGEALTLVHYSLAK